jgi:predicted transcriptional regulator
LELRIQQIRKSRGITQADLALSCDTTQQQIAKIESGLIDLKLSTLRRIALALNCELPDLFYTEEQFVADVDSVIKRNKVNVRETAIIELIAICYRKAQIPHIHPYWERVSIKGNKLQFKEKA